MPDAQTPRSALDAPVNPRQKSEITRVIGKPRLKKTASVLRIAVEKTNQRGVIDILWVTDVVLDSEFEKHYPSSRGEVK
jgi:hypothetical protein